MKRNSSTASDSTATAVLSQIREDEILELASNMIRIPSFKGEETKMALWLADYFKSRGYQVDLQEVEPGRFQTIATLKGTGGGRSLMFNGHIDVDPIADGWKRDPWTPIVVGDRLYGEGIFNMKGGDTSMITAAEAIRRSGIKLKGDLVIACVVGELQGGVGTVHLLKSGLRTDAAIVTEPFGSHAVITTHAGVAEMAISTIGFSQHITKTKDAVDAIAMMMKAIPTLRQVKFRYTPREDLPLLPFLLVGGIIGGRGRDHNMTGPNFTSDYCTALIDVRYLPSQTVDTVVEDIRAALDGLKDDDPDFAYEIQLPLPAKFRAGQVVMEATDVPQDEEIVQSVVKNYKRLTGNPPKQVGTILPLSYGGTDMAHLWKAGISSVNYGPEGIEGTRDEPDTCIYISDMVLASKVLALTGVDFCGQAD